MAGKCSNPNCAAPINCHEGKENIEDCEFWQKGKIVKQQKITPGQKAGKRTNFPWSGDALTSDEIPLVTFRNSPIILGIVGKADAGKTTFLAMLYTLLLKGGRFENHSFAGTKTIKIWDELYHRLKVQKNNVKFPDPTPAQYLRLFHLALRDAKGKLKDILLSDASGEVFSVWARNREHPNAENARWVYHHATGFVLFIDCENLIDKKNLAKTEIIDLAQMLRHDLKGRPVIAVWSKSDRISQVHPTIKESLRSELESLFSNYHEIEISNFSSSDPDILVHENNLKVLDWLLKRIFNNPVGELQLNDEYIEGDIFLNYKGQ